MLDTAGAIARKELALFFGSPIGYLFLAAYLGVTLFVFFWGEAFFARNIADVRPMFEWLPILLIFLSAALTMRMWSDERRVGDPGVRHHRPGERVAFRARQVRRLLGAPRDRPGHDGAARGHRGADRGPRLGAGVRRLRRGGAARRGLRVGGPLRQCAHGQPDRLPDPRDLRLRRALLRRQRLRGGAVHERDRRRAAQPRHRGPLRVHRPRRARPRRPLLLRVDHGGIPGTERAGPREPWLGGGRVSGTASRASPRHRPGGAQLRRGQPLARGHQLAAPRHDRGPPVHHLGRHALVPGAVAGAAPAAWLLQRQDPPAARAARAADQGPAPRVRGRGRRAAAARTRRPGGRPGTRGRGQQQVRHPRGAVPDRGPLSGEPGKLLLRRAGAVRGRVRGARLPRPDRGQGAGRVGPRRAVAQPGVRPDAQHQEGAVRVPGRGQRLRQHRRAGHVHRLHLGGRSAPGGAGRAPRGTRRGPGGARGSLGRQARCRDRGPGRRRRRRRPGDRGAVWLLADGRESLRSQHLLLLPDAVGRRDRRADGPARLPRRGGTEAQPGGGPEAVRGRTPADRGAQCAGGAETPTCSSRCRRRPATSTRTCASS